jgi:hypothetical protein
MCQHSRWVGGWAAVRAGYDCALCMMSLLAASTASAARFWLQGVANTALAGAPPSFLQLCRRVLKSLSSHTQQESPGPFRKVSVALCCVTPALKVLNACVCVCVSLLQGTMSHMAPEALLRGHISKAADVYSFGVTLWELFTGCHAYHGEPEAHTFRQQLGASACNASARCSCASVYYKAPLTAASHNMQRE